ncbi:MAG: hypothetical protein AB7U85_05865 [Alphaproteobacteria bacterium]
MVVNNITQRADNSFLWCKRSLEQNLKLLYSTEIPKAKSARMSLGMVLTNLNAMERGTGEVNKVQKARQMPISIPKTMSKNSEIEAFVAEKYNTIMQSKGFDLKSAKHSKYALSLSDGAKLDEASKKLAAAMAASKGR